MLSSVKFVVNFLTKNDDKFIKDMQSLTNVHFIYIHVVVVEFRQEQDAKT